MKRAVPIGLILAMTILLALSEHLAFNRIFVVDELQNVFQARLLATHQAANFLSSANLLVLGPMTWIAGAFDHSAPMLRAERILFFLLFWVNLALVVRCAGFRLRSRAGAIALLLVATFATFWHYGFEIRHENPLLTTVLLAWLAARPLHEGSKRHPFLVGGLAVIGQFFAFKAFVYLVPIVLFTFVAAWWFDRRPLLRVIGELAGGAIAAFVACRVVYYASGTWTIFSTSTQGLATAVFEQVRRMNPMPTIMQFLYESPVLVIGIVIAAVLTIRYWNWKELVSRDSLAPEAALCLSGIVGFLANPSPFPYNLLIPTAEAAVLCLRLRPLQWSSSREWKAALAAFAVIHIAVWGFATRRHYVMTNARQAEIMSTAEQMTDPQRHRIFDGAALVPTRLPPMYFWLITFITLPAFHSGELPPVRSDLAKVETPIIIPNYRVLGLPREDREFIGRHYLPLANDFLVAGARLTTAGVNDWECLVSGRYYVATQSRRPAVNVDGIARPNGAIALTKGVHRIEVPAGEVVWLIWLGPTLSAPPALGPGNAKRIVITFA